MIDFKELHEKVRHLRVLVVDDEQIVLESTLIFMRKFFDKVDGAPNGAVALEMYLQEPYDVVMTDIKMPKLDGNALIVAIKKFNHKTFIVSMSGTVGEKEQLLEQPDKFFQKPVDFAQITHLLESLLEFSKS